MTFPKLENALTAITEKTYRTFAREKEEPPYIVWDDDDNKRATAMVPEWDGYDDDDLYEEAELPLRNVLKRMKEKAC